MTFDTKRCYITNFKEEDIDAFMEYRNNHEWMKWQNLKGLSKDEYIQKLIPIRTLKEGMQLAVFLKENNRLIGDVYLKLENDNCWIGYSINPRYARQGYMTEVVISLIDNLSEYGVNTISAEIDVDNLASINFIKKFQFELIKDVYIFKLKGVLL